MNARSAGMTADIKRLKLPRAHAFAVPRLVLLHSLSRRSASSRMMTSDARSLGAGRWAACLGDINESLTFQMMPEVARELLTYSCGTRQ